MARLLLLATALGMFASASGAPDPIRFERDILPILDDNCLSCHDDVDQPEGGVNLERFRTESDILHDRDVWGAVYDKVESHQMPPPKRRSQPTSEQRQLLLGWLREIAGRPDPRLGTRDPGRPVLRRLTRLEYNNSVRDLFGLREDVFLFPERVLLREKRYFQPSVGAMGDVAEVHLLELGSRRPVLLPAGGLPADNRAEHGYRNRGDAMNMSPLLFEQYVALAGEIAHHPDLPRRSQLFAELLGLASGSSTVPANSDDKAPDIMAPDRRPFPERLQRFLGLAFRRSPRPDETKRFTRMVEQAVAQGSTEASAMRTAVQAILSSPAFLFLAEQTSADTRAVRPLDDHELASRLSYFLWSSTPDGELLAAAQRGELRTTEGLRAQMRRMVRDVRVRELSESFAVQWLRLDQLYTAQPDRELFKGFYSGPQGKDTLHSAMLVEALLLFETVLVEDRSIIDFIDADYTWLNPRLARHYGIALPAPVAGGAVEHQPAAMPNRETVPSRRNANNSWRRVALADRNRGGYMTMAGPLTVTSLPFRTSPVKRGAWLLETIFNRPPQEPKIAFAVSDDTKEAAQNLSIRERFEAHRSKPECYSCHVRLDPPGFALERFSPIGAWRETDGGTPVDARAAWNGIEFDSPAGFKQAVMKNPDEFIRGFVEHLLAYALGRKLGFADQPAVAEIQRHAKVNGNRLSAVLEGIVASYPFRHIRNQPPGSGNRVAGPVDRSLLNLCIHQPNPPR